MTAAKRFELTSVEEYLASEIDSPIKREYVDGHVYPRGDMCVRHNRVAGSVVGSLYKRLEGAPCHIYGSDMKIRIVRPPIARLYYPDACVVCKSNPPDSHFQDRSVVVFEVISENTRRLDECEKTDAYLTIPSLATLALVESAKPAVVCPSENVSRIRALAIRGLGRRGSTARDRY
jgi:Uma2 family endonuclease